MKEYKCTKWCAWVTITITAAEDFFVSSLQEETNQDGGLSKSNPCPIIKIRGLSTFPTPFSRPPVGVQPPVGSLVAYTHFSGERSIRSPLYTVRRITGLAFSHYRPVRPRYSIVFVATLLHRLCCHATPSSLFPSSFLFTFILACESSADRHRPIGVRFACTIIVLICRAPSRFWLIGWFVCTVEWSILLVFHCF